jgi:outer membrane protein assembly factor BamB
VRRATFAWALLAVGACGGAQGQLHLFSTQWEDDHGNSIERVFRQIGGSPIPAAADVVVGVSAQGDTLIGVPLSGDRSGVRWAFAHPLDARPVATGNVVVGSGGGEAFALVASTGEVMWRRKTTGLALVGAGDDGDVTVLTFQKFGGLGSVLLGVKRDGELIREIETEKALGGPALVHRVAFVPWAGEYVSAIDLWSGDETARVTLREETSRAWTAAGSLWFGELAFTRFDERIAHASEDKASTVTVPYRDLPGTPKLMPPGATPLPAAANATDKVRLYARPSPTDGGATIEDGRYYATYFRVAMGFDARGAKLAWVHVHSADFLGGAAAPGGIVLCDEGGNVVALDATAGTLETEAALGQPIRACVVNVDALHVRAAPGGQSLIAQIEAAVRLDDPMIASAQRFLLRELVKSSDPSVTQTLVDLASDPRTGPDLLAEGRADLAKRRNGASFMEAALERHYDFLKDVLRAPPVGPIADALAAMHETPAASLLASHLLDPADSEDDVRRAAAALAVIGGAKELPAMRQFFAMYRASAEDDDVSAAVVSIGKALLGLTDPAARAAVAAAVEDPMTVPYAKEGLQAFLSAEPSAPGASRKPDP